MKQQYGVFVSPAQPGQAVPFPNALPGTVDEQQARIAQIDEIRAGLGDDIVDMTSQRFAYVGDGVKVYGGLGNDTIWANNGNNSLFGDAGNDRLVGGSDDDIIIGGAGNDSMHGGGGEDISASVKTGVKIRLNSLSVKSRFGLNQVQKATGMRQHSHTLMVQTV